MTGLDWVFLAFGVTFTGLLFFGFFWTFSQAHKDRAVKRELALRFYPDKQGNYPKAIYSDGTLIEFQTGNNSAQVAPSYIIQPVKSEVISALPSRPEPLLFSNGSEVESPSQPQQFTSQQEVVEYLLTCKQEGMSQTKALKSLGITGGPSYQKFAAIYKQLAR